MAKMAKNLLTLDHIYSCYPLYRTMYGSSPALKTHEMAMSAVLLADWFKGDRENVSLLELFCGNKEHADLLYAHSPYWIEYTGLDMHAPEADIKMDARKLMLPNKYDAILAVYHSIETTVAEDDGLISRRVVQQLFANCKKHLNKDGCMIIAYNGLPITPDNDSHLGNHVRSVTLHPMMHADFFEAMSMTPDYGYKLVIDMNTEYDRISGCTIDTYNSITVNKGDTNRLRIEVEKPFVFRYWSESEIIDMAKEAGFTEFSFYASPGDLDTSAYVNSLDELVGANYIASNLLLLG